MAMTIDELFERRVTTAREVLRKADTDVVAPASDKIAGSFEHFIDRVREPVTGATPCPKRNADDGDWHYPNVKATFSDHALVGCDACGKNWNVPFSIGDDGAVLPGDPSERVAAFVAPGTVEGADGGDAT